MPKNIKVKIMSVLIADDEVTHARPGENVTVCSCTFLLYVYIHIVYML